MHPAEGRQPPGRTGQPERRGEAPLPDGTAIKGRSTPARLPAPIPQHSGKCTSHLGLGLICPQGKFLRQGSFHNPELAEGRTSQYVARQKDCQAYPVKEACLPPKQKRRYFTLTMYYPEYLRAKERNRTDATGRSLAVVRPSPMEPSLPWAD